MNTKLVSSDSFDEIVQFIDPKSSKNSLLASKEIYKIISDPRSTVFDEFFKNYKPTTKNSGDKVIIFKRLYDGEESLFMLFEMALLHKYFSLVEYIVMLGGSGGSGGSAGSVIKDASYEIRFTYEPSYKNNNDKSDSKYIISNPLFILSAVKNGNLSVVEFLTAFGANINNEEVMNEAVKNGHLHIVKYLIEQKCKYEHAVHLSIDNNHLDILKYFVSLGAKIESNDLNLTNAAGNGNMSMVKYLYELGVRDDPALICAVEANQLDIVKYLIEMGEDVNYLETHLFNTPLTVAIENNNLAIVKCLVEAGAELRFNDEERALCCAAEHGHIDILKYLIDAGADINGEFDLKTPLCWAVKGSKSDVAHYLISIGANVHIFQPICLAVLNDDLDMVKCLVKAGADVNSVSEEDDDKTSIYYAVEKNNIDMVKYLVGAGADIDVKINDEELISYAEEGLVKDYLCGIYK